MRTCAVLLSMVLITAAMAQTPVPLPPKPADSGPNLQVTMKFIQDKLNDLGKVNYASYGHDSANGNDWVNQFSSEASNVVADSTSCRINYHRRRMRGTESLVNQDFWFSLRDVKDVIVLTADQDQQDVDAEAGHPTWVSKIVPSLFVLRARRPKGVVNSFYFKEEELANRVAKAMVHAVELCGGGGQPEPF